MEWRRGGAYAPPPRLLLSVATTERTRKGLTGETCPSSSQGHLLCGSAPPPCNGGCRQTPPPWPPSCGWRKSGVRADPHSAAQGFWGTTNPHFVIAGEYPSQSALLANRPPTPNKHAWSLFFFFSLLCNAQPLHDGTPYVTESLSTLIRHVLVSRSCSLLIIGAQTNSSRVPHTRPIEMIGILRFFAL